MKKYILSVLLVINSANVFAQGTAEEYKGRNEFKLNTLYLLAGFPEISYERLTGEGSAVGMSVGFAVINKELYNFSVIPYYRLYFGNKPANGFFIEGNGAVFSQEYIHSENMVEHSKNKIGVGLGVSFGVKFLTKKGWIGELVAGIGRNFVNTDKIFGAYPRFGITVGKRF